VFCGVEGKVTAEHVYGRWLAGLGLTQGEYVRPRAGLINRIGRDLGVAPPFQQTVRDVCRECNNGWLAGLEATAARELPPLIRDEVVAFEFEQPGLIAAWAQKTAIVSMLVASKEDRQAGYGVPPSEFGELYERRFIGEPLPATRVWIAGFAGSSNAYSQVTPLVVVADGLPDPPTPQAYLFTQVVGHFVIQGVRFRSPGFELEFAPAAYLPQLWPEAEPFQWPLEFRLNDATLQSFALGAGLTTDLRGMQLRRWKAATDLEPSQLDGTTIALPAICGRCEVQYPAVLAAEAQAARYSAFVTRCECDIAYLVMTEPDGAHVKAAGSAGPIAARYEHLVGEEIDLRDENGVFVFKRIPSP
jgi:hypothetical protein